MNRREALRRASLLVGGALILPDFLVACERAGDAGTKAASHATKGVWTPKVLSPAQATMVATVGEIIIPTTTTPGARAAQVERFVDNMLSGFLPPKPRERFLAGLERMDARSRRAFGKPFLEATADEQRRLVVAMNNAAYTDSGAIISDPRLAGKNVVDRSNGATGDDKGASKNDSRKTKQPSLQEGEITASSNDGTGAAAKGVAEGPGGRWDPQDVGRESFFINLKGFVIEGYYTSEVGATQELRVNPWGTWQADVAYPGHAWA